MRRKYTFLCATMIALLGFGGCGAGEQATAEQATVEQATVEQATVEQSQETIKFTDDLGREVTVECHERVATLIGNFTDIWMPAGGEVIAAANDSWESLELDLGEEVVNLGSIQNPDVEELLVSNPAWASLSAVQKGNYYVLEKRLFNLKPNARWGEAYEILADILYPVE